MKQTNFNHALATLGALSLFLGSTLWGSQLPSSGGEKNDIEDEFRGPAMQNIDPNSEKNKNQNPRWNTQRETNEYQQEYWENPR